MTTPATLPADFFTKKKKVSSSEAPATLPADFFKKAPAPKTAQAPQPKTEPAAKSEGPGAFESEVAKSFGADPQKLIEAYKGKDVEGVGGKKTHLTGQAAQWAQFGEDFSEGLRHFGLSVLKDPFKISEVVEAPARGIEEGISRMLKGDVAGGGGALTGAVAQVLGGAEGVEKVRAHSTIVDGGLKAAVDIAKKTGKNVDEATTTAHKLTTGAPSRLLRRRAFEDQYVHSKGLEVAKKVDKAVKAVNEEVKTHAEGIASQIDTKIPTGVVDAGAESALILKEFNDIVKAPEKAHPVLVQMVKDAQATAPKLWSWEKARQFRSSVGRAISGDKVVGPQKVVLTKVYVDLTKKLGGAAKQYGLEKSWNQYNELASKMDKEFSDITDDVTSAKSGQEVASKLGKDVALTSEMSRNLSKYGLKHSEIIDFVKTSKRIQNAKNFMNRSIFRLVYGSPPGLMTAMAMRMGGAPYIAALGAGATVGWATAYLVNQARLMRLSPEVIEHMMKERELPGRMKFEPGQFPSSEAHPELPEGPTEPGGEPEDERIRRLGAGAKESMADQVKAAEAKTAAEKEAARLEWEKKQKLIRHPSKEPSSTKSVTPEGQVVPEVKKAPKDRWYRDKGSIPGEPVEYLDVPGDDLDSAKAAIREHESPKGTKFEAITSEGKSLGTFDTMDEAKTATEAKFKKAELGEHGKGKLAEQAKARERVSRARSTARRTKEAVETEAKARAQATHMDVSQLQIPEMEEYLKSKNPTALSGLTKLRKAGVPDAEYIEALKYLILEDLEK